MEEIVNNKMKNYQVLLNHGNLSFNQHQYDGVKFCINRELNPILKIRGGFIADEMGLGKTITIIATIYLNYVGNSLIILPPALLSQWSQEIKRTTGHNAIIYHGTEKKKITKTMLEKAPIVLATYNAIQSSKKEVPVPNVLHEIKWGRIVFDEAHHLRNSTLTLEGALKLKSKIRWLISGTPIQNRTSDFHNLCQAAGIMEGLNVEKRKIILENLVLRRTKKEVGIFIPSVTTNHEIVRWSSGKEKKIAEEIHSVLKFSNVSEEKTQRLGFLFESQGILQTMLRARQICTYPILMKPKVQMLEKSGMIEQGYTKCLKSSSKLDKVVEILLSRKDNGNGKIIFCHYRSEINEISKRLTDGGMQNVEFIDGRTKKMARQRILKPTTTKDNSASKTLILQIQVGCEGLNLQEDYSEIYFVTPHWNPSVEDQAIARCHRIGQKKEVTVFRFEMEGFDDDDDNDNDIERIRYKEDKHKQIQIQTQIQTQNEYEEIDDVHDDEEAPTLSLDSYIINTQNKKRGIVFKIFNH